jgi:WD40 repeat protein
VLRRYCETSPPLNPVREATNSSWILQFYKLSNPTMSVPKYSICVSTTKPSSALTPNGGGGSVTVIDPQTGAILSSLRSSADLSGNASLGISSLSSFPSSSAAYNNTQLVIAYGANTVKKSDTYGMLLALRNASLPPVLHWKCRLPEAKITSGLIVSPCGNYVVGGGDSGSCYIWSALGGFLLKTFRAHYRACTCITWTKCGLYVVTGGADGMVHIFSLMDLVDQTTRNSKRSIAPMLTWSNHHFPVTCVINLDGGRLAAAAEDGQVVIMESFCKQTVAILKFPHGICSLTYLGSRLYAGSALGTIYSVDLDAYAMHQTEKQGATLTKRQRQENQATIFDRTFVKNTDGEEADSTRKYQTDWIGHEHAVTAIAVIEADSNQRLISGDEVGTVRIWDVESRVCINVLHPWATTTNTSSKIPVTGNSAPKQSHPISCITVVPQPPDTTGSSGMFAAPTNHSKAKTGISNLIAPLQKYAQDENEEDATNLVAVPFLSVDRSSENLDYWQAKPIFRKRKQQSGTRRADAPAAAATDELLDAKATIEKLQKELEEKQQDIKRWEKVNNKLMAKLKTQK